MVCARSPPLKGHTPRLSFAFQIPLFTTDTDGKPPKSKNIMGRRNYTIIEYDTETDELCFDIRVEKAKGVGTTVGYVHNPKPTIQSVQRALSLTTFQ